MAPADVSASRCEHALDRPPGACGNDRIDRDLVRQRFQRPPDVRQGYAFHVRTQVARAHELDLGMVDRYVVAHRALRHHDDTRRLLAPDIVDHRRCRPGEIGFGYHFGRTLRMREHDDARVLLSATVKRSWTSQCPAHAMISTPVWAATFCARYSSGSMITRSVPSDSTIFLALADVQQMSDSAFTAADVLT